MATKTSTQLRRAAETLAGVSITQRRAVLDEAERLRREQCRGGLDLSGLADPRAAVRVAEIAKALSDPVRVQVVEVLRRHGGEICQCDLAPLFDLSQPTLSHHLSKLVTAGLVAVERRGRWAHYSIVSTSLEELRAWPFSEPISR